MEATMFHLIKDFSNLTLINLAYCWKFRNSISSFVTLIFKKYKQHVPVYFKTHNQNHWKTAADSCLQLLQVN